MKTVKVSLDPGIQLLGMIGVLGGLVFVGMEMRQSQTIAFAAQNQARVAPISQSVSSTTDSGINFLEIIGSEPSQDSEYAAVNTLIQTFLLLFVICPYAIFLITRIFETVKQVCKIFRKEPEPKLGYFSHTTLGQQILNVSLFSLKYIVRH